ncbi:hypothetical protein GCM10023215_45420 [Pseudonocardia yuanmonensis]|uniref:HTH-type transcriptional repressor KstR2 C-terminal domain-containing protein n=1 Tax=Pseudonocardia yuanmonensis TaxID=1095914 RepID=A0ABP8X5V3_9PSEU
MTGGPAGGVFDADSVRLTGLALSSLGTDVPRWYDPEGEFGPEQIADHYCRLALRMVGSGRSDGRGRIGAGDRGPQAPARRPAKRISVISTLPETCCAV